jgi:hypothetical protein
MYLSMNIFQYFFNSLAKLSDFFVIECANWKATILWTSKVKEQCRKHRKRMNDNLLQFFWKNSSQTLSSSNSISSSFLVHFELFKNRWLCQLGLYKTSLYSKAKDATIKDLKQRILICFIHLSLNIEPLYTKHPISCTFLYQIERFFWYWKH